MLKTIYISRHGSRQDWIDPTAGRSVTGMYHDPSLSQHGLDQAEELGTFLAAPSDGSPTPELIFSSPFYRCLQTATPLAEQLQLPIRLELGVMEWFSKARQGSGLHSRPYDASKLQQYLPRSKLDHEYTPTYFPSRGGESLSELTERIGTFVDVFVKRVEEEHPKVETISIVAHAATVIILGRALLGDAKADIRSGTAATSKYVRADAGETTWSQEWNGKASYLTEGEERHWGFDQVVFDETGEVIEDAGDGLPFTSEDEQPVGLAKGLERYLA